MVILRTTALALLCAVSGPGNGAEIYEVSALLERNGVALASLQTQVSEWKEAKLHVEGIPSVTIRLMPHDREGGSLRVFVEAAISNAEVQVERTSARFAVELGKDSVMDVVGEGTLTFRLSATGQ